MAAYVGNIDAPGGTGNQSYTSVGFLPQAVIFWGTTRLSAGSNDSIAYSGFFGMTDGTTSHVTGMAGSAPSSNSHQIFGDTSCVKVVNVAGTILQEAEIVSLDNDGFTLNWTTAGIVGADVNFIAIAGSSLTNVKVGVKEVTASGDTVVTGVGFQADMLLLNWFEGTSFPLTVLNGTNTIGQGLDDGTKLNGSATSFRSSIIDSGNSMVSTDSSIHTMTPNNAPVSSGEGLISAFGSDGFTITMATHAGINLYVGYLAMKGASNYIWNEHGPGGTGAQATTGAGFTPELYFVHNVHVDSNHAEDTALAGTEDASMNIGAASSASRVRFSQWACDVNGDGGDFQSITHVMAQADSQNTVDRMSTLGDSATFTSFDADGATITWDVYTQGTPPLLLGWMFAGGSVIGTYDNKLIYADGVTVT